MSPDAKKFIKSIMRAAKRAKLSPLQAVEAMVATAAATAIKFDTHCCPAFFDLAHEMYHTAEAAKPHEPVSVPAKDPACAN